MVSGVHVSDRRRPKVCLGLYRIFGRERATTMTSDGRRESVGRRMLFAAFAVVTPAEAPRRTMATHPGTSQEVDGLEISRP
jgi:hypothetical protein